LSEGEEFGRAEGLGLVPGRVTAIPKTSADGRPHKVPHIGWNAIHPPSGATRARWRGSLLEPVSPGAAAYFVHSYTAVPENPAHRLADCHYNGRLVSAAIRKANITATQFHPEKSGPLGLAILSRFVHG
jgi:glutamine amidotransferase